MTSDEVSLEVKQLYSLVSFQIHFGGEKIATANMAGDKLSRAEIGIRPEFISFSDDGLPARTTRVSDTGRFNIVEMECTGQRLKLLIDEGAEIPVDNVKLSFDSANTRIYVDGWLSGPEGAQ